MYFILSCRLGETMRFNKAIQNTSVTLFVLSFAFFCGDSSANKPNRDPQKPQKEYTAETPREWQKYVQSHLPRFKSGINDSDEIFVYLEPPKQGEFHRGHYIEKIGIMDQQGRVLAVKEFAPGRSMPYNARFRLKENPSKLKIFSRCNLHDLWSAPLEHD